MEHTQNGSMRIVRKFDNSRYQATLGPQKRLTARKKKGTHLFAPIGENKGGPFSLFM